MVTPLEFIEAGTGLARLIRRDDDRGGLRTRHTLKAARILGREADSAALPDHVGAVRASGGWARNRFGANG
jgi:hypothetical protein